MNVHSSFVYISPIYFLSFSTTYLFTLSLSHTLFISLYNLLIHSLTLSLSLQLTYSLSLSLSLSHSLFSLHFPPFLLYCSLLSPYLKCTKSPLLWCLFCWEFHSSKKTEFSTLLRIHFIRSQLNYFDLLLFMSLYNYGAKQTITKDIVIRCLATR